MPGKGSGCFNIFGRQRSDHDEHLLGNRKIVRMFSWRIRDNVLDNETKERIRESSHDHHMFDLHLSNKVLQQLF